MRLLFNGGAGISTRESLLGLRKEGWIENPSLASVYLSPIEAWVNIPAVASLPAACPGFGLPAFTD